MPNELAAKSYNAELMLLRVISLATAQMEASGTLTSGLANLLAGIEDKHEGHCYLLKQRLGA
jgi:predicted ABC-type transport system involved in lysophospholipase L1 biosynthesis ATPase subunit